MGYPWLLLVFVGLLQLPDYGWSRLSSQRVEECLRESPGMSSTPAPTKPSGRQLFLYFGDAGIEAVSVLKEHDIRRINNLARCVTIEDVSLFEDRTGTTEHFHDGGSNVTFLTGIFQELLPDLDHTIRAIAQKAVQRAEWEGDITALGIRSVQYLSFYKPGLKAYRQEKKRQQLEKQSSGPAFVVFPDAASRERREKEEALKVRMQFDPDADEVVGGYLQQQWEPAGAVAFTAVLQLSDRSQFAGGEVLVSKVKRHRTHVGVGGAEGGHGGFSEGGKSGGVADGPADRYEDEDEDEEEDGYSDVDEERRASIEVDAPAGATLFPRFSAEDTKISRFTPELGSMLLSLGDHPRGLRPVLFGRRASLVIEYWAYADAPLGAKRPSLQEARPRAGAHAEL